MLDSSVFIYSVTASVLLLLIAIWRRKMENMCTTNSAPPPSDDDEDLSGLRLGEVCVIPYGGGAMLGQLHIPPANPVYFVPDRADAETAVRDILHASAAALNYQPDMAWDIQHVRGVWWFARKYYHDTVSLRTFTAQLPIVPVTGVQEAVDYLTGLRTSGDRRGRPQ